MTKNDKTNCTFAGGKNCIFLEALSFFCYFSVIFLSFWRNILKNSEKYQFFFRKMTKKWQCFEKNAIFATCKSAFFFVVFLSVVCHCVENLSFFCRFGASFSKIVNKIEKFFEKWQKNDRQNWNDKKNDKKMTKKMTDETEMTKKTTKKWQTKWQTKLKWQKKRQKMTNKMTDKTEMTKKTTKKWQTKWQTKLKWQNKWQKKRKKKWQNKYFDFFNLCLPKFLLTVWHHAPLSCSFCTSTSLYYV